jgi:maltose O-acetyltransferase
LNGHIHIENAARVDIGKECRIGPGTMFFTMVHRGKIPRVDDPQPIALGDRVWLAGAVRVLPGVKIGTEAVVAAGAVVMRDVSPGVMVGGVPARAMKAFELSEQQPNET